MSESQPSQVEIVNVQVALGWYNPTVSRALVCPANAFYIQYDSGKGETILGHTNGQVSFSENVVRIDGNALIMTDVTLRQNKTITHVFKKSTQNIDFDSLSYIGDYTSSVDFSVFLGFADETHPLYLDVSTFTGILEYHLVNQPSHQVHYFSAASKLRTYNC